MYLLGSWCSCNRGSTWNIQWQVFKFIFKTGEKWNWLRKHRFSRSKLFETYSNVLSLVSSLRQFASIIVWIFSVDCILQIKFEMRVYFNGSYDKYHSCVGMLGHYKSKQITTTWYIDVERHMTVLLFETSEILWKRTSWLWLL